MTTNRYRLQVRASQAQQDNRQRLLDLYESTPIPSAELLANLALYTRSSVVAKWLWLDELYRKIVRVPGTIMEFGVWWGQTIALMESFRAVYEPYNWNRRIVGFDTFAGYPAIGEEDGDNPLARTGGYAVSPGYRQHLEALLEYHEAENTMGHVRKWELVEGDVSETLPRYLSEHAETIVALAIFDLALYKPTLDSLRALEGRLTKGSVIAFDELQSSEFPGETQALREAWGLDRYRLVRSEYLPDRSYVIVE